MTERSELARQKRHYGAVRERLARSATAGRSVLIAELEGQLAELASDNDAKARRIAALEFDLADAEARLLAQAQVLLSSRGDADAVEDVCDRDNPAVEEIVAGVLENFPGVTWEDIISVRRDRWLVKPRHACMRAVYERRSDLSLSRIGRIFRRDHTTVLQVVRKPGAEGTRDPDRN